MKKVNKIEAVSKNQENEVSSNENVKLKANNLTFTPEFVVETEETKAKVCFEKVDLKSQDGKHFPELKEIMNPQPLKKPFSFSFTPIFKKSAPKVQVTVR